MKGRLPVRLFGYQFVYLDKIDVQFSNIVIDAVNSSATETATRSFPFKTGKTELEEFDHWVLSGMQWK